LLSQGRQLEADVSKLRVTSLPDRVKLVFVKLGLGFELRFLMEKVFHTLFNSLTFKSCFFFKFTELEFETIFSLRIKISLKGYFTRKLVSYLMQKILEKESLGLG
jgi:hypothetical protein